MKTQEPEHESTYYLTGAAVVPTDRVVLPPKTMVIFDADIASGRMSLWAEDEVMAARPSEGHYLTFAAVWVPGDVLDES